jgi:thiol-disulfide isomerase/thioredoxin
MNGMDQRDKKFARISGFVCLGFFLAAAVFDYWPSSEPLNWLTLDAAKEAAWTSNKPILLDVYAEWCAPCKLMDRQVFPSDSVTEILRSRYVLARFNVDDPALGDTLKKTYAIRALPTYIVLSPRGKERKRHVGFFPKSNFVKWLGDSSSLLIVTWPDFSEAQTGAFQQKKRILVLVLKSGASLEQVNTTFESENVRKLIHGYYVPTLLFQTDSPDRKLVEELGAKDYALDEFSGLAIVLEPDRKEVGRFNVTRSMQYDETQLLQRLEEFHSREKLAEPGAPPSRKP